MRNSEKKSSAGKNHVVWKVKGYRLPVLFFPDMFKTKKKAMGTDQRTAIMISRQAMEFIAANGGHATLYLVPRPAVDG
jgi:hypothetical protein